MTLEEIIAQLRDSLTVTSAVTMRNEQRLKEHDEWLRENELAIARHRQWLEEQQAAIAAWHAEIAARDRVTDERIGHLVSAIGELLRRMNSHETQGR